MKSNVMNDKVRQLRKRVKKMCRWARRGEDIDMDDLRCLEQELLREWALCKARSRKGLQAELIGEFKRSPKKFWSRMSFV